MNTSEYKKDILGRLKRLEEERGVKVLYAAVVGSRAYGLESEDSDCDTKFIFIHPLQRYLDVDQPVEYLDAGDDVTGYDLRKFLQMARKSGFNTFEMVYSPEVVMCAGDEFLKGLREVCQLFIDPRKMCISYTACMLRSKNCFDKAVDERDLVKHAVAATRLFLSAYVCRKTGANPPVVFDELVRAACGEDSETTRELRRIADAKRKGMCAEGVHEYMEKVMQCGDELNKAVLDEPEGECKVNPFTDLEVNTFFKNQLHNY